MTNICHKIKTYPVLFNVPLAFSRRSHKIFQLPNGILTLVISDAHKDSTSVALCVASGSFNDPDNIPGLAPLCEHALLLGSREFPDPTSYNETIIAQGGRTNAYTTGEQTCFYFDLPMQGPQETLGSEMFNEPIFENILRRFASFFKCPKFNSAHIKSEVSSVDEEHISNTISPEKILFHGMKILANDNHPFKRFATGNLHSIRNSPKARGMNLHSELLKYYHQNYIPSKMTLVISGPQSLNQLQKASIMNFSLIPQNFGKKENDVPVKVKKDLSEFSILSSSWREKYQGPVFDSKNMNRCLFIKSKVDSRIRIMFPTKLTEPLKGMDVFQKAWVNILGDESIGSLCSYLIESKSYALLVYLFVQNLALEEDVLIVEVKLTHNGERNMKCVVIAIFQFIQQMILNCPISKMAFYLSEMNTIDKLNYIYMESNDSLVDDVSILSENLQQDLGKIKPKNILRGRNYWSDNSLDAPGDFRENPGWWSWEAAKFVAASREVLNPRNFNLLVLNGSPSSMRFLNKGSRFQNTDFVRDFYYQFEYTIYHIDYKDILENALQYCTSFSFPKPNPYLAHSEAELIKTLGKLALKAVGNPLGFSSRHVLKTDPQFIDSSRFHETWFKLENVEVLSSKAISTCRIQIPGLKRSPLTTVGIDLLCELVGSRLRHELYPGESVGYSWGLFPGMHSSASFTFTVSGLKDKLHAFLHTIIEEMYSTFSEINRTPYQTFKKARVAIRREYQELMNSRGIQKAIAGSLIFLEESIWSIEQRLSALEEIDLEFLSNICMILLKRSNHTTIFMQGNLNIKEIANISEAYNPFIIPNDIEKVDEKAISIRKPLSYSLKPGKSYIYEQDASENDPLNTAFYYIQIGERDDIFNRTLVKFVSYLFSISVVLELRTKKQLGYSVYSGMRILRTVLGVYITILSGRYGPMYLNTQIEEFINEWEQLFEGYSDDEFEKKATRPFVKTYSRLNRFNKDVLPSSINYGIGPMKSSSIYPSGDEYSIHRHCWESIVAETYRFGGLSGEEEIDINIIKDLSRSCFLQFVKKFISIKSRTKTSLSLLFSSRVSKNELERDFLKIQIREYLTEKGFSAEESDIESLLNRCKDDSISANKELYKWFKSRNEGTKFVVTQVRDFCKSKVTLLKLNMSYHFHADGIPKHNAMKVTEKSENEFKTNSVLAPTRLNNWEELHAESFLRRAKLPPIHYKCCPFHTWGREEPEL